MTKTHIENSGYGFFMGPGFINHDGVISGYTCSFSLFPDTGVTVAVLGNGPVRATGVGEKIRSFFQP